MIRLRALALVPALLLVAGCAGGDDAPSADTAAAVAPALSAESVYGRHAAVRGKVDVRIANLGTEVVEVERYQVRHPMFEVVPADARRSSLPPDGEPRIVPVGFGAPRCDVDDPTGAEVVLGVRAADGVDDVVVPLSDGEPGLVRAHQLACAADAVTDAVGLDLAAGTAGQDGLDTALQLRRRGPGEVAITEIGGNILFTVDAPSQQPLVGLPAGQDAAEVAVRVRATRCEAHALTESKRSFVFPVFVSLDGGEPTQVQVTVSPPAQASLQALLDRTCGPTG